MGNLGGGVESVPVIISSQNQFRMFLTLFLGLLVIIFLFVIGFRTPSMTLHLISEPGYAFLPHLLDGEQVVMYGYKFSKNDGVVVSTPEEVRCVLNSNGYKACDAIFSFVGDGMDGFSSTSPIVLVSFYDGSMVSDINVTFSTEFKIIEGYSYDSCSVSKSLKDKSVEISNFITGKSSFDEEGLGSKFIVEESYPFYFPRGCDISSYSVREFSNFHRLDGLEFVVFDSGPEKSNFISGGYLNNLQKSNSVTSIDYNKPFAIRVSFEIPISQSNFINLEFHDKNYISGLETYVSGCGDILSPGVYTLDSDIGSYGVCLNVESDDVILDCAENSISYGLGLDFSSGVYSKSSNVTIHNCKFIGSNPESLYSSGVYLEEAFGARIINSTFFVISPYSSGINLFSSSDSFVSDNVFYVLSDSSYGLIVTKSSQNSSFNGNLFNVDGLSSNAVLILKSSFGSFNANIFNLGGGGSNSIYLYDSHSNTFNSNTFSSSGTLGSSILCGSSIYNSFFDNNFSVTGDYSNAVSIFGNSHSNNFSWINLQTTGVNSHGFYFYGNLDESHFSNLNITNSGESSNSLFFKSSDSNVVFVDSFFNSTYSGADEIYFDSSISSNFPGLLKLINVVYDSIRLTNQEHGFIERYWYFDAQSFDVEENPLYGVEFLVSNLIDGVEENYSSDESGFVRAPLLFYSNLDGVEKSYSNYYVSAKYSSEIFEVMIINNQSNSLRFDFSSDPGVLFDASCFSRFECTPWSECFNGSISRVCVNKNPGCNSSYPSVVRKCLLDSSSKEALFDINLELLSDHVEGDYPLSIKVFLLNIGVPGEVDANVYYEVYDEIGDIVYSESEVVKVQTQIEYLKTLDLSSLPNGRYTVRAELSYLGQVEPASSEVRFFVGDVETFSLVFYSVVFFFFIVLLLILYFFLVRSSK